MADTPDYDKLMEQAAAASDTDKWLQAYRAKEALRAGASQINGQPTAQVIGTPQQVMASTPTLPAATPVPASNPNQTAYEAEMITKYGPGGIKPETLAQADSKLKDHYNSFLADQGINPNTIGNSQIVQTPQGQDILMQPTLAQEQAATSAKTQAQGRDSRARTAANRMQYANPALSAQILSNLPPAVSNYERLHQYYINRFMMPSPAQQYGASNPFAMR